MNEDNDNQNSQKKFEALKKFFESDMKIKKMMIELSPNSLDEYNEESKIKYVDKMYSSLRYIKEELITVSRALQLGDIVIEKINNFFENKEKELVTSDYDIKKLYKSIISDMNPKLVEEVKEEFAGYTLSFNISKVINHTNTINELLHVIHSYITNNDRLLQSMPILKTKPLSEEDNITLYGDKSTIADDLFRVIANNSKIGDTDIISMDDKIIMMVRDLGHALTVEIDILDNDMAHIQYFVPKLCNREKIEKLRGINLSGITNNGATGQFEVNRSELSYDLNNFLNSVPTDEDIIVDYHKTNVNTGNTSEDIEHTETTDDEIDLYNSRIVNIENDRGVNLKQKLALFLEKVDILKQIPFIRKYIDTNLPKRLEIRNNVEQTIKSKRGEFEKRYKVDYIGLNHYDKQTGFDEIDIKNNEKKDGNERG